MKKACVLSLLMLLWAAIVWGQSTSQPASDASKPAEQKKTDAKADDKKTGNPEDQDNPVEKGVTKGSKATAKGAVYTGQAAADGSKQAAKGVTKGAKWVARPWGRKEKKSEPATTPPAGSEKKDDQKKDDTKPQKN